jgi:hypothetical protein
VIPINGVCDEESDTDFCFTFEDIPMPPTVFNVTLSQDTEDNTPIPAYDRGYYFDGNDFL